MFERYLSDKKIEMRYAKAGARFGDAVSYIYMGECLGFESMLSRWEKYEALYIERGYRALPLDDFIDFGGYGIPLKNLGSWLGKGEEPIYHAKIYRDLFLGNIEPSLELRKLIALEDTKGGSTQLPRNEVQFGTYYLPSTKKENK